MIMQCRSSELARLVSYAPRNGGRPYYEMSKPRAERNERDDGEDKTQLEVPEQGREDGRGDGRGNIGEEDSKDETGKKDHHESLVVSWL